jgi:hypothetical protein
MIPISMLRAIAVMGPRTGIATIPYSSTVVPIASTPPFIPTTNPKSKMNTLECLTEIHKF